MRHFLHRPSDDLGPAGATTDARVFSRGFTLIELLVTTTIIAVLSVAGLAAFQLAKASARDGKRVSDAKQIQTAVEFYFENHSAYPTDGAFGPAGVVLGDPDTSTFSDAGFAPRSAGTVFMDPVPANPAPNGSPYIYRSLHRDGRDCDFPPCDAYAVIFTLERGQGSFRAGAHALTSEGVAGEAAGFAGKGVLTGVGDIAGLQETAANYAQGSITAMRSFADDPMVENVAETAVSPFATGLSLVSAAVGANAAAIGFGQLVLLVAQPFLLARRRRGMTWGVTYDALSKLPVDLAVIRLFDATSGRLLRTAVTDRAGRYVFLVGAGRYRITATKPGYVFPSAILTGVHDDGRFHDIYLGEALPMGENGIVAKNMPGDPTVHEMDDATAIAKLGGKKHGVRMGIASFGPALGFFALVIKPTPFTALLFGAQLLAYLFFKRLIVGKTVKRWGAIHNEKTGQPVEKAIVRIFALPYKKLLETQVTDKLGRYSFLVGGGKYFLTVSKEGYYKTETDPLDLSMMATATAIASDIPLRPVEDGDDGPNTSS